MWDWSLHLYWYWMPTKFWVKNKGGRVWLKIALRLQAELTFITYIYFPFTTALIPWWWFILYGRKKEGFSPVCEITLMGCWVDVIFGINLWQYLPAGTNERMSFWELNEHHKLRASVSEIFFHRQVLLDACLFMNTSSLSGHSWRMTRGLCFARLFASNDPR